ncbi:MAG: hypothetical protein QXS83_01950 [Thermoplasmata archaeon]
MKGKNMLAQAHNSGMVLLLCGILLMGMLFVFPDTGPNCQDSHAMVKLKESFGSPAPAYVTRGPLHIVGDEDFARQAAMNNWPGNGTECNPYIIEGYEIDGNGSNAIWIENTSVHFIIRNCNLYNATGTDKA